MITERPLFDDVQLGMLRDAIGSEDLLAMLQDLPPAAQRSLDEIADAVTAGDIARARRAAHTLKGCAGSFGAAQLSSIAAEIELQLPSLEAMNGRLPALAECLRRTVAALADVAQGTAQGA